MTVLARTMVKMLVLALTEELPNGKRQWLKMFRWHVKNETLSKEMGFAEFVFGAGKGERWSAPYLAAAQSIGITKDWQAMQIAQAFTRKEVALMIANVLNMVDPAPPARPQTFTDIGASEAKYQTAIAKVSNYSIFSGYPDDTFKPDASVTRAEAVTALTKLMNLLNS
jgi:hypothetical protein